MHTIRLRGPWQLEPLERYTHRGEGRYCCSTDDLPAAAGHDAGRLGGIFWARGFLGRVRYRRTFQRPTGLDSGERVWLVIEAPRTQGTVLLGDEPLGTLRWGGPAARYDITERLEDHNRLEIIVAHPALDAAGMADDDSNTDLPGGLIGDVRLEIEE